MDFSFLADALGTAISAGSGGLFGAIGAFGSSIMKFFTAKQEHKQKIELMRVQMELNSQAGSWASLQEGLKESTAIATNTYKWVNAIKALYRPILTSGLFFLVWIIFNDLIKIFQNNGSLVDIFSKMEAKDLLKYIVYSVVFTACSAGTWWFCERALSPPEIKNR